MYRLQNRSIRDPGNGGIPPSCGRIQTFSYSQVSTGQSHRYEEPDFMRNHAVENPVYTTGTP